MTIAVNVLLKGLSLSLSRTLYQPKFTEKLLIKKSGTSDYAIQLEWSIYVCITYYLYDLYKMAKRISNFPSFNV